MKFYFELYLKSNIATKEAWQQFFTALTAHIGYMKQCQIIVTAHDGLVRYFVSADKDLGILSNNIDIGVLRPVKEEECAIPQTKTTAERFVSFGSGGNILDLKEKTKIKRGKDLEILVLRCRRINAEKTYSKLELYFKNPGGHYTVNKKTMFLFPAHLLAVNFDENARYLRKEFPKYINIEKALPILSPANVNALLAVSTFPYFANDYYLNLQDFEFDKHSFIIGASGSGKSKFIELLIDRISKSPQKHNYRILVIDPHASLGSDLSKIESSNIVDFNGDQAPELFGDAAKTDVSASTELTTTLMKSLLGDQFNPKVERVLRFSLYVLFVAQTMSLGFLKRFLTELELRNQIIQHVSGSIPPNIEQFFLTDFNEIRTTHYTEAILPIVSLVDEMQLQPGLVGEHEVSLAKTIEKNFLTVFSLNKVNMGEKVVKTAAGILIQQIFLLAQSHAFNERVILFIDEVSVVQNPALASILAEARKYNLFVVLTQQYFGQVEKGLRDSIFANVYNYYVFRVSEEDADSLVGNLTIDIPKEIVEEEHKKGIKEEVLKKRFLTELHPRECLVRVSANGQIVPVFKARTLDIGSSNPHTKIALEELQVAKPTAPKISKFVEEIGSASETPAFPSSHTEYLQKQPAKAVQETMSEVNSVFEKEQIVSSSVHTKEPFNPESEMSFVNNPEIDPIERRDKKEQRKRRTQKLSRFVSKQGFTLEEALPAKVVLTQVAPTNIDVKSGFGSGNLASILAGQSSSRELVNKRKG